MGTAGDTAVFLWAYFWVLRNPLGEVAVMPATWLDALIGLQPWSFALYASLWVYISFGTALWFWNTFQSGKGIPHDAVNQGLGATINIINGIECNNGNAPAVANRVKLYKRFCEMLGVDPGPGQGC